MKRIVIAVSLVSLMLIGTSTVSAGLIGACNANLGRGIGDAQRFLDGHQDCTNIIFNGNEFTELGCFPLLFADELFSNKIGDNAFELLGTKICTAACICFAPVPDGSDLDLACGCPSP